MKARIATILAAIGVHGHLSADQKRELVSAGMQAAPGVAAAGGASVMGLQLSDWLVLLSMVFVLLQAAYLIWKWRREARREAERARLRSLIEPDCSKL